MIDDNQRSGKRISTRTRRGFLSTLAAGAFLGTTVSTTSANSPITPRVYVHPPKDESSRLDHDNVMDAAEDFADQWNEKMSNRSGFGEASAVESVRHDGDIHQQKLHNQWEDVIPAGGFDNEGIHHFVIDSPFDADILSKVPVSADDIPRVDPGGTGYGGTEAWASKYDKGDVEEGPGVCITNWGALQYWDSDTIAENLFKHETLHTYGAKHQDGTLDYASGWLKVDHYKNITPMATSYVERDPNPVINQVNPIHGFVPNSDTFAPGSGYQPSEFSKGMNNHKESAYFDHKGEISDAAWGSVDLHARKYFDVGSDYCDALCRMT